MLNGQRSVGRRYIWSYAFPCGFVDCTGVWGTIAPFCTWFAPCMNLALSLMVSPICWFFRSSCLWGEKCMKFSLSSSLFWPEHLLCGSSWPSCSLFSGNLNEVQPHCFVDWPTPPEVKMRWFWYLTLPCDGLLYSVLQTKWGWECPPAAFFLLFP